MGEPKLVKTDELPESPVVHEFQGESVADTLIRARQQVGQDLRSIAEVLCIRYSYLDAIERGQYENLPGATYAVGFVRTYSEYLGLDGEVVVERFKNEVEGLDSQTKLHFPTPAPEGKMPGMAVFLVAALLFAGAYGVWFYLSNNGETLGDLVAPVPDRLQEMVDGETPPVAADTNTPEVTTSEPAAPTAVPSVAQAPGPAAVETPAASAMAENPVSVPAAQPTATPEPVQQSSAISAAPGAPTAVETTPLQAAEAPMAPSQQAESMASVDSAPQVAAAAPEAENIPAAGETAPAGPATAENAPAEFQVPGAPVAESPVDAAPAGNDPLAIPAAPDNSAPATAFLVNHEPKVYGEENADSRIVLKANQDAWVQVRDRQGTLLLTRVLRVGDSYRVPNQGDLTLLTGNAGGLEISVDGRALAPLGPVGAVRRNIPLDPQALAGEASR